MWKKKPMKSNFMSNSTDSKSHAKQKVIRHSRNFNWPNLVRRYWALAVLFFLSLLSIHLFLYTNAFHGAKVDPENAEQFGGFIGGYIGTMGTLLGVFLLIVTLLEQTQKDKSDGFERRFFQMLDYHRENIAAIGFGEKGGARTFVTLIREFRLTLDEIEGPCVFLAKNLTQFQIIDLAYMSFYYGTGPNSTRVLRASLEKYSKELIDYIINLLDDPALKKAKMGERKLNHIPFEGHQSRLGHYFRHLYAMVRYIDEHGEDQSEEFAGILRAQLSNHEQALLCLNSLSTIGRAWKDKGLLVKYQMIKNIPKDFFDPNNELDIKKAYPEIKFEYEKFVSETPEPNRDVV